MLGITRGTGQRCRCLVVSVWQSCVQGCEAGIASDPDFETASPSSSPSKAVNAQLISVHLSTQKSYCPLGLSLGTCGHFLVKEISPSFGYFWHLGRVACGEGAGVPTEADTSLSSLALCHAQETGSKG